MIVDDYSRFSWVKFLRFKNKSFSKFRIFVTLIERKTGNSIGRIHSDHGGEFDNKEFEEFCNTLGIEYNFSAPRTPQQNGVAERKNKTLIEAAHSMLNEYSLPKYFWAEAVNTTCYVLNRVNIRLNLNKTSYELLKGKTPNLSHLHVFGCKCYVHNNGKNILGKFDAKSDEGIFLGYSIVGHAYRVFNRRTLLVEESVHVSFDESFPSRPKEDDVLVPVVNDLILNIELHVEECERFRKFNRGTLLVEESVHASFDKSLPSRPKEDDVLVSVVNDRSL